MRKHLFVFLEYSLWIAFLIFVFLGYRSGGFLGLLVGGVLGAFVIGVVMLLISINENLQFLKDEYSRKRE
jgi:hypothetical protein